MAETDELILAEFEGTYKVPHPQGFKGKVLKPFHVRVKIKRESLDLVPMPGTKYPQGSLCGLFQTYYTEFLKKQYPDLTAIHEVNLVQATELDGSKIVHPNAMSHEDLVDHISKKKYPIDPMLFDLRNLRNQVMLYLDDPKGQQVLQANRQAIKGSELAIAQEIRSIEDVMEVLDAREAHVKEIELKEEKTSAKQLAFANKKGNHETSKQ